MGFKSGKFDILISLQAFRTFHLPFSPLNSTSGLSPVLAVGSREYRLESYSVPNGYLWGTC